MLVKLIDNRVCNRGFKLLHFSSLDCVQPVYDPGHYVYRSSGFDAESAETCGLYIIASPDKLVQVEFDLVDVSCQSGLIAVSLLTLVILVVLNLGYVRNFKGYARYSRVLKFTTYSRFPYHITILIDKSRCRFRIV